MSFLKDVSLTNAASDFRTVFGGNEPYQWWFRGAAVLATCIVFGAFLGESGWKVDPKPYKITYVESLDPNRTEDEIVRENLLRAVDEKVRERKAEQRAEAKREAYKRLARQVGMDVDE